jgi:hypothetical protein
VNPWIVLPWLAVVAVVFVLLPVAAAVYSRFRQPWRVPCPLQHADASIQVDAAAAARSEILGRPTLSVVGCSFWPERGGCAQGCVHVPLAQWRPASSNHTTLTPA